VAGTVSALGAVVLEAAQAAGVSGWSALRPRILREVAGTTFGTVWSLAGAAWVLLGALVVGVLAPAGSRAPALRHATLGATGLALPRTPRGVLLLLAVPLAYLALVPALSGHGSTQPPTGVMFPANVAHVVAMAAWVGGLVALLLGVPAATRRLDPSARSVLLAAVLPRFSAIALGAVAVLALTGLVQAYVEVRHLDLLIHTAFGRAVLIKAVLLLALVALGALNRRRTVPALQRAVRAGRSPGADGVMLRRTLRGEVALLGAVLGVTGALAGYPPSVTQGSGPYSTTTRIGPQEMGLTLDPARVGPNELHLYLTDPRTGAQLDAAKEVDVSAALPANRIGSLREKATKAGPGHYIVPGFILGVRGRWRLTVTVRVSDFDEYAKHLEVPVR
jgi:copper transport protein